MEEVTAKATAIFNTGIFIPLGESVYMYDLDKVITKDGFGDAESFDYVLTNETTGVFVEDSRMSVESSASREISIRVSSSEKDTEAFAVTKPYIPYTAVFNTNIETPAPTNNKAKERARIYDLDVVITKYGFENTKEKFTYELLSEVEGLSLTDNILAVSDNVYGKIEVLVTGGKETQQAIARTKTTGFYATALEIINNEQTMIVIETAIQNTKTDWPTLVGANKKAG